jgi:hypothetical protein
VSYEFDCLVVCCNGNWFSLHIQNWRSNRPYRKAIILFQVYRFPVEAKNAEPRYSSLCRSHYVPNDILHIISTNIYTLHLIEFPFVYCVSCTLLKSTLRYFITDSNAKIITMNHEWEIVNFVVTDGWKQNTPLDVYKLCNLYRFIHHYAKNNM